MTCDHQCSGNCRRVGCHCGCGEWHCPPNEPCRYTGEECPNHPVERAAINHTATGKGQMWLTKDMEYSGVRGPGLMSTDDNRFTAEADIPPDGIGDELLK